MSIQEIINKEEVQRVGKLDALRGYAISMVFVYHFFGSMFSILEWPSWDGPWRDWLHAPNKVLAILYPLTFGWIGVSLFFVLSGYCIHLSTLKDRQHSWRKYAIKRFWRIYPVYLIMLCFFAWFGHLLIDSKEGLIQFISHLLLVHNLHNDTFWGINASFWSLATEAQLYLIYPLFLVMRRWWGLDWTMIAIVFVSLLSRCFLSPFEEFTAPGPCTTISVFPTVIWFDWCLGAWLAERHWSGCGNLNCPNFMVFVLVLILIFCSIYKPGVNFSFQIASILFVILVDRFLLSARQSWVDRMLVPLGLCSYSFYLCHQPLIYRLEALLIGWGIPNTYLARMCIGLPITFILLFGLSWILYLLIEKNAIQIGRRILSGPTSNLAR